MRLKSSLFTIGLFAAAMGDGCVQRLDNVINTSDADALLVVDGSVTNEPVPCMVKLSRANKVGGSLITTTPFFAKRVTVFDDQGNSEILTTDDDGVYHATSFQGVIGRQYFIRIETLDGKIYESVPEIMRPAGSVDSIYYEIESHQPEKAPTQYGFRIFADFSGYPGAENLFRWKFTGTYHVVTHPELRSSGGSPDPPTCSGLVFDLVKRTFKRVDTCSCCICWPNLYTSIPLLSDNSLSENGQFKKIEVGYVPIEYWTFFDKTMVYIQQLSMSQQEFAYWKAIEQQLTGADDLFQPVTGKVRSNIFLKSGTEEVLGYFSVSGVSKRIITLTKLNIPSEYNGIIPDPVIKSINQSCIVAFSHSSNKAPYYWK